MELAKPVFIKTFLSSAYPPSSAPTTARPSRPSVGKYVLYEPAGFPWPGIVPGQLCLLPFVVRVLRIFLRAALEKPSGGGYL